MNNKYKRDIDGNATTHSKIMTGKKPTQKNQQRDLNLDRPTNPAKLATKLQQPC